MKPLSLRQFYFQGVLLVFALSALGLGLTACSKNSPDPSDQKSSAKATSEVHEHKEVWTCPMHPQIKQDGPGSCPICHMNLVKADISGTESSSQSSEYTPDGHAPFKLSLQRQQMIGVRLGTVEKKPLFKSVEASGRIAFDPELYTAQNEYLEALKQEERVRNSSVADVKHSAERMVESAKLRLKILGLSDAQIKGMAVRGTAGPDLLIPKPGENLWVYAEVFEMDLSIIRPGLEATITGSSLKGDGLRGKVVSVDRVINPNTRTAKVRILIPDTKASLRPEAYVDVTIHSPLGNQVTVPFDAILDTGKQAWVFVVREGGEFEPRLVRILERAGDEVAIESGVHPGDKIVTSANFLIDSESRLKGVLASQDEAPTTGADESSTQVDDRQKKTPECPKGQFWHEQMKHCMAKPGK